VKLYGPDGADNKKTLFGGISTLVLKRSIYQDRLRTNIGKEKLRGEVVCLQERSSTASPTPSCRCAKRHLFLSFPYVCPEPVLATSFLYINGSKMPVFAGRSGVRPSQRRLRHPAAAAGPVTWPFERCALAIRRVAARALPATWRRSSRPGGAACAGAGLSGDTDGAAAGPAGALRGHKRA
jgi:hypothetical protein